MPQSTEIDRVQIHQQKSNGEVARVIEVPTSPTEKFSWTDVATGISEGSWAVILTFAVIYVSCRGPISKYLEKHIGLLETMRESLQANAQALTKLADSETRQAVALESLRVSDAALTELAKQIATEIPELHNKSDEILARLQGLRDIHVCREVPKPWWRF